MPTSKLNLDQKPPSENGISNGSALTSDALSNNPRSGNGCFDGPSKCNPPSDIPPKLPQSILDKFAQDTMDDSGVASGSSILSSSSNETLDHKTTETTTDGSQNGDRTSEFSTPAKRPSRIVSNGATSSRRSPELRVRFNDSDSSDTSNIPASSVSDISSKVDSEDSPTEIGATGVNPTLWLGDDQMLLLPGNSRSEETDSNSGTSDTKSFEGLLSPNGTSILWDEDTDWILLFDNMIRYADRKQHRTTRSCGCKGELLLNFHPPSLHTHHVNNRKIYEE